MWRWNLLVPGQEPGPLCPKLLLLLPHVRLQPLLLLVRRVVRRHLLLLLHCLPFLFRHRTLGLACWQACAGLCLVRGGFLFLRLLFFFLLLLFHFFSLFFLFVLLFLYLLRCVLASFLMQFYFITF